MLRKIIYLLSGLLIFIIGFAVYVLLTTGFFREIENSFDGELIKKVAIPGAEDFAISYEDQFLIISSDPRKADDSGQMIPGGLYYLDLNDATYSPRLISKDFNSKFYPHGISMLKTAPGEYKLWVVNHVPQDEGEALNHLKTDQYIETFSLIGDTLLHLESLSDPLIKSPNDVVAIDEDRFYFSNDHFSDSSIGRLSEDYLAWSISNVVYYNGSEYKVVDDGISYANGINYDRDNNRLWLASPRGFLLKVYSVLSDGNLEHIEDIDCNTGVDNIEFDANGKIWIGCHPNLIQFAEYAQGRQEKAPSEIITIDYTSKGEYELETVYLNDGSEMSASTVASVYGNTIFVGNVMDDEFIILRKN